MTRYEIPAAERATGELVHGFRVDRVTELGDVRARCYECTHAATGARLVHLHCNDDEKLYAIAFRTPVGDSTGMPHILEHSVLAGSRKYPVKDAFTRLGKTSLATYLNAFTYPDKTIYPVCSALRADYFNLASVYTDLVFHPLLTKKTFMREGHHLELVESGGPSGRGGPGRLGNRIQRDEGRLLGRRLCQSGAASKRASFPTIATASIPGATPSSSPTCDTRLSWISTVDIIRRATRPGSSTATSRSRTTWPSSRSESRARPR